MTILSVTKTIQWWSTAILGSGDGTLLHRGNVSGVMAQDRFMGKPAESAVVPAYMNIQPGIGKRSKPTMSKTNAITICAAMLLPIAFGVYASPLTPVVKAGVKAAEKAGAHAGGKAVVRGGTAFAAATARHEAAKAAARTTIGKIAECATPGRILATGGATALVVGTHETADGCQTVCESIGDAVHNNPEMARGIMSDFFALPKTIIALTLFGVVVVLVWFLWPVIALARSGIQLAIVRKHRAILEDASLPTGESGKTATVRNFMAGFTRIGVVWAVAGFIVLTLLGVWRMAKMREMQTSTAMSATAQHVDGADERLRAEYNEDIDRIYKGFLAEVDAVASDGFGRTRANMPDIVGEFDSMSHCAALVKAMVADRLFGGNRVGGIMQQDLAPFYDKLYTARDDVAACVYRLAGNLVVANRAFAQKLGKEFEAAEASGDEAYKALLEQWAENIEDRIVDLTSGQFVAGISVAAEAVCIRETVATVAKLLGGIAARQAGTMAASAGAAIADGPFPIGDIIGGVATIGCTLWSGWDVYQASKVLPRKLADTLRGATDECERQCREEACRIGADLVSKFS